MVQLLLVVSVLTSDGVCERWRDRMLEADRLRLERRYEDAQTAYADALEHAQKLGTNSLPVALTLNNIGYHYQSLGRFLEAERALARSLEIYERTLGAASHMSIQVATNLSGIYVDTGRLSKAESLARRFLGVGDDLSPEDTASMQAVLGSVLLSRQNLGEAEMMFRRAMAFFERDTRQEALERTVITLSHLAIICLGTNRPAEARAHSGRARTLLAAMKDPPLAISVKTLANAAAISAETGAADETESLFQSVVSLCERGLGRDHYLLGQVLSNYSGFLRGANRKREAKALAMRAKRILDRSTRDNLIGQTVDVSAFR